MQPDVIVDFSEETHRSKTINSTLLSKSAESTGCAPLSLNCRYISSFDDRIFAHGIARDFSKYNFTYAARLVQVQLIVHGILAAVPKGSLLSTVNRC
jgi:hypothetical protein